ncbi:sulfatase [Streptomyces sp. NPDC006465]|uniref:sulfatase n=1 Tax=Streptomyces sp. NPDC006465 TaxID=3157174 RepID=UPI0033AB16EB
MSHITRSSQLPEQPEKETEPHPDARTATGTPADAEPETGPAPGPAAPDAVAIAGTDDTEADGSVRTDDAEADGPAVADDLDTDGTAGAGAVDSVKTVSTVEAPAGTDAAAGAAASDAPAKADADTDGVSETAHADGDAGDDRSEKADADAAGGDGVPERAGGDADGGGGRSEKGDGDGGDGVSEKAAGGRGVLRGRLAKYPQVARVVTVGTTVLAGALVLFGLLVPNKLERLEFGAFVRIPAEGVLLAALLLALPPKPRRITSYVVGALLGLVTILKFVDMGFYSVMARPFDLVLDWILFENAADWVKESFGRSGEIVAVIAVVVLVIALLVLMTLAVARLTDVMVRHRPVATRTTLVLGTAWITCVTLGVQFTDVPVASQMNATIVQNRVDQVQASLHDGQIFAKQASVDAFADTPPDQLLTGLRGKDVLFTFIESYGRTAIDDPAMSKEIDSVLSEGTSGLKSAGFSSRSAWLRSPVTGAGSWLAHSTFLSGLWIKNQQRYRSLTTSDRNTLTKYFQKTGAWDTVGIVPGVRRAWPEGKFFGLDRIYDSEHLGYNGPYFSWTPVPDQFSLGAFERLEHGKKNRKPMMAEIILASSHNPWAPIAHMIDWNDLGDGSVYNQIKKEGKDPKEVWKNPESVRREYRNAIEYSLHSLTQYVEKYGDKNTVLVFLGDHQPVPTVTAGSTSRDVPVTIVAKDPKVLARISDWGWTDGLKPAKNAPEWRMDTFRDRFMTAYGPHPGTAAATPTP